MASQWNRRGRRLLFETIGSLSRADLSWVNHARYGFSGEGIRIERTPLIIDSIPTLVYNGKKEVNEHSRSAACRPFHRGCVTRGAH